jgi:nucleoid-associated protein YgaU
MHRTATTTTHPDRGATRRLTVLAGTAGIALVVLVALPIPSPPARPDEVGGWWESIGTASATMSILRTAAIGFAAWILVVSAFGAFAAVVHWRPALRVWHLATPAAIRRLALASAVLAGASTPTGTLAADPPPLLHDLGPADTEPGPEPALLVDLGPAAVAPAPSTVVRSDAADGAPPKADEWVVERGDHLWRVAEETLGERGEATTDAAVARYWRELIALNRGAIGPDPDLIHPGTVLTLP